MISLKKKYSLTGLHTLKELEGSYYNDLPPFLIRRLEDRTIKCLRIDSTLDMQVKYDIFERLNSGSVELTPQELRNSVYRGKFNEKCKEMSKNNNFRKLLQIPLKKPEESKKVQKMEDVEIVIRFFAFIDGRYKKYKKTKDYTFINFLNEYVDEMNRRTQAEIDEKAKCFEETINIVIKEFGELAYAKYRKKEGKKVYSSKFNISVFDAVSVAVYEEIVKGKKELRKGIKEKLENLFDKEEFFDSISGSTMDRKKVLKRIETVRSIF